MVALGCAAFFMSAMTSLNIIGLNGEIQNKAKLAALDQQNTIRDFLITKPGPSAGTCMSRLNLTGSEIFDPTAQFDIPITNQITAESNIRIDRIYLDQNTLVSTTGTSVNYSGALMVQQSVKDNTFTFKPLPPSILGSLRVTVSSAGQITGCSWDIDSMTASAFCSSLGGTTNIGLGGAVNCNINTLNPTVTGACPGNTTMDLVSNRCVPINDFCVSQKLSDKFDGNLLTCAAIPAGYAIQYPTGYTPPAPPPTAPPALTCNCGGTSIPAGGSALCTKATAYSEWFGNYDQTFDVMVCNSAGQLEVGVPSGYFEEDGQNISWNYRVSNCTSYGGTRYYRGKLYTFGRCS